MNTTSFQIIFVMILVVAITGFGASFTTVTLDKIGGDNNVIVPATNADVTKITLTESNNNITSATVTVKNTDTVAHTFRICMITKDGAAFSDTSGTDADCAQTASVAASSTASVTISFSNPLTAAGVDAANLSIKETA